MAVEFTITQRQRLRELGASIDDRKIFSTI